MLISAGSALDTDAALRAPMEWHFHRVDYAARKQRQNRSFPCVALRYVCRDQIRSIDYLLAGKYLSRCYPKISDDKTQLGT